MLYVGGEIVKKYPCVLQSNAKDCGVACLLSIVEYYDGFIKLERLRELSKTTKEGVSAYHLIECAKKIGFDSEGIKCNIMDLQKNSVVLPAIVHVIIDKKYAHYMVIYEVNKKHVIVGDPAKGIRKIKIDDFLQIWDGITLSFVPNRILPIEKKNTNIFMFFANIIKTNLQSFKDLIILSLFGTLFGIIMTFYLQSMMTSISLEKPLAYIVFIFIFYLVISFLKIITDYFRNEVLIHVNHKIDIVLTQDTFKNIILLPYRYYHTRSTGDIVARMNDLGVVKDTISKLFVTIFIDLSLTILSLIVLSVISFKLTMLALILLLMYLFIFWLFNKPLSHYVYVIQNKKAIISNHMVESISGFQTIKGLVLEKKIIDKFKFLHLDLVNQVYRLDKLFNNQLLLKELVSEIGTLILLFIGIIFVRDGSLTMPSLITYNMLFSYFIMPIRNIIESNISIKESKGAVNRILDVIEELKHEELFNNPSGEITFYNVNFSYDGIDKTLKNINLKINCLENVVITGKSGSGKSTLFKLLIKYYQLDKGVIKIGNNDINNFTRDAIRTYINYISQNEIIFTDTLYNNIVLDRTVSEEDFLKVVKVCQIEEIASKSSLGFNMLIEENGFNLSGGEKQRIFLARCLLSNAKFLIIDEAMNAMDVSMERKILKSIIKNYHKTLIMITHRTDNVDLFDRKIEIQGGRINADVRRCIHDSK